MQTSYMGLTHFTEKIKTPAGTGARECDY